MNVVFSHQFIASGELGQHLTDRHHNARKSRRTYRFSKDWRYHEAATYLTLDHYNFC